MPGESEQDVPIKVRRQRLEHAGMLGLVSEFEVAPFDVAQSVALGERRTPSSIFGDHLNLGVRSQQPKHASASLR